MGLLSLGAMVATWFAATRSRQRDHGVERPAVAQLREPEFSKADETGRQTNPPLQPQNRKDDTRPKVIEPKTAGQPQNDKTPTPTEEQPVTIDRLNEKILEFATNRIGRQVGNGECWTLAADALANAGATRPGTDGRGVYAFGRAVMLAETRPGDIVQFKDAVFLISALETERYSHHTAIIESVNGTKLKLLNQNVDGNKNVSISQVDMKHFHDGEVLFYRPTPK